jgi:hypothetical protein
MNPPAARILVHQEKFQHHHELVPHVYMGMVCYQCSDLRKELTVDAVNEFHATLSASPVRVVIHVPSVVAHNPAQVTIIMQASHYTSCYAQSLVIHNGSDHTGISKPHVCKAQRRIV